MQELEKILEEIGSKIAESMGKKREGLLEAENIIRKHMNDGWIPVEERLPEKDGFYIATMDGEVAGQEDPFTGLAEFENGKWIDDEDDYRCVIAWRPLPEPYHPERSEIKLKPCPFCGCDAAMFMLDDRYTARCRSCFCGTGEYKDPERASETWNRRADNETD